ncbi:MAG: hypothetical protein ACI4TL_00965, partial [Candidatus Cryptobacteroides sp.]
MAKTKTSFAQVLQQMEDKREKKLLAKLPLWAETEGLQPAGTLALEQSSSQSAAHFKAELLSHILPTKSCIADLTGGMGSDSWAFSEKFSEVHYFEKETSLCEAAEHNFRLLCQKANRPCNIKIHNLEINPDSLKSLSGLKADCIYLDPARRNKEGKKVFLIEDCSPNLLELLPTLESLSPYILVKYSPMADISMLRKRIGESLSSHKILSIGICSLKGEVKEVLVLIGKEKLEIPEYFICELEGQKITALEHLDKACSYYRGESLPYLLEPSAALLKSGYQSLSCTLYGALKLSPDCQLYLSPQSPEGEFSGLYKCFKIIEINKFSRASLSELSRKY